jgi:hypothetical protein
MVCMYVVLLLLSLWGSVSSMLYVTFQTQVQRDTKAREKRDHKNLVANQLDIILHSLTCILYRENVARNHGDALNDNRDTPESSGVLDRN